MVNPVNWKNCEECDKKIPDYEYNNRGAGLADTTGLCYRCAIQKNRRAKEGLEK